MSGNNETKQVYVRWSGIRRGEPWMSAPSGPWGAVLDGGEAVFCDADYVELERKTKGMADYEGIRDLEMYVAELQAGHLLPYNPMIAVRREIAESPAEISATLKQKADGAPVCVGVPEKEYERMRKARWPMAKRERNNGVPPPVTVDIRWVRDDDGTILRWADITDYDACDQPHYEPRTYILRLSGDGTPRGKRLHNMANWPGWREAVRGIPVGELREWTVGRQEDAEGEVANDRA